MAAHTTTHSGAAAWCATPFVTLDHTLYSNPLHVLYRSPLPFDSCCWLLWALHFLLIGDYDYLVCLWILNYQILSFYSN